MDLRSNNISNVGLHWMQPHLLLNPVLHTLDLRGNDGCSAGTVFELRRVLWTQGSDLNMRVSYLETDSTPR